VREQAIRLMAAHPVDEYRRGMMEMAMSEPDLVPALSALDLPLLGVCGTLDSFPDEPQRLAGMKTPSDCERDAP
jgi:hypothetical protein